MLIDTHAHLNFEAYENDFKQVIDRALEKNIALIIPASNLANSKRAIEIAEAYEKEGVYAAVGLHPIHVFDERFDIDDYRELAQHPKVVALGEVGLDYFHNTTRIMRIKADNADKKTPDDFKCRQKKVLNAFLELSQELRLPLILHCREAHEDLIKILTEFNRQSKGFNNRGVVHCFSGNYKDAKHYFNLGFFISFTGVITYKSFSVKGGQEVIEKSSLEKILVETDAPYLSPEPYRASRNEPINVKLVAEEIARLKKIDYSEVAETTTNNTLRVFPKTGKLEKII